MTGLPIRHLIWSWGQSCEMSSHLLESSREFGNFKLLCRAVALTPGAEVELRDALGFGS